MLKTPGLSDSPHMSIFNVYAHTQICTHTPPRVHARDLHSSALPVHVYTHMGIMWMHVCARDFTPLGVFGPI